MPYGAPKVMSMLVGYSACPMRYGLWQARVISHQGQRDVPNLTRERIMLVQKRSREVNRVHGVLEQAYIMLASVATAIMDGSGWAEAAVIAELAKRNR